MKLYFLRHGKADWPHWDRPDDERPLTDAGRKQMERVAQALARLDIVPDVIVSSPLPRAHQTAQIAADALRLTVMVAPALAPGFGEDELRAVLRQHAGKAIMLVGHEPDFSNLIETLTGGVVVMPKAGIARVDVTNGDALDGELRWLVTPKFLR